MYNSTPPGEILLHSKNLVFAALFSMLILNSCKKGPGRDFRETIYVESNDYHDNQNAIIAYKADLTGKLQQIPGSPFYTQGAGVANPTQKLGPDDNETPMVIYKKKYLLAVNGGSNTIAVLKINVDGTLQSVPGSPFASGGSTPSSLAIHDNYLYVVNKNDDPLHPSTVSPNYTTFTIDDNGALNPVAGSTFETTWGSSPSQVLVSDNGKYLFGDDFLGFMQDPPAGTLRSFVRNNSGTFTAVAGTPYTIPEMGGALGLWQHPKANVLYVGFPLTGKLGIYKIEEATGSLTFQSSVTGGAASCWIRVTKDGRYLYLLNSAENTISIYNTSNPLSLVVINKFTLKEPGPLYPGPMPGTMFTTSEDFHLAFSGDERVLYVVSQHTNADFSIGSFNFLHTLLIANDGNLSEPLEPTKLPVTADIRPQGVAIF